MQTQTTLPVVYNYPIEKQPEMVNNYPKSSCRCSECTSVPPSYEWEGIPTNLSVRNCHVSKSYDCYPIRHISTRIQPNPKEGYRNINPQVMTDNYAPHFVQVDCPERGFCKKAYTAPGDSRLIDVARAIQTTLDLPPLQDSVKLDEIYSDKLKGYGTGYRTYSDINAGQIVYYVNESQEEPFFSPNFTTSATVNATLYQDPMSAMKPAYERVPLKSVNPMTNDNNNYEGGLSWIQDSQEHRADLMSKQLWRTNQQKYTSRWSQYETESQNR